VRLSGFARSFACRCAIVRNVERSETEGRRERERDSWRCGQRYDVAEYRRQNSQAPRSREGEAAGNKEGKQRERVGVLQVPRPVSQAEASGSAPWTRCRLVGALARYGRQSMGLRGPAGAPHVDSGHADLDATECVPAKSAQGVLSSGESGVHH